MPVFKQPLRHTSSSGTPASWSGVSLGYLALPHGAGIYAVVLIALVAAVLVRFVFVFVRGGVVAASSRSFSSRPPGWYLWPPSRSRLSRPIPKDHKRNSLTCQEVAAASDGPQGSRHGHYRAIGPANMDREKPESRGVSISTSALESSQKEGQGRSSCSPPLSLHSRKPAPDRTDGAPQEVGPIMDGDGDEGWSGDTSQPHHPRHVVGTTTVKNTSRATPSAPASIAAVGSADGAGSGARTDPAPPQSSAPALAVAGTARLAPSTSAASPPKSLPVGAAAAGVSQTPVHIADGSALHVVTPRQFMGRLPPHPSAHASLSHAALNLEGHRPSVAISLPPDLDLSFVHQPTSDYISAGFSTSASGSGSGSVSGSRSGSFSGSGSASGLDSSWGTSSASPKFAPGIFLSPSRSSTPRTRSYSQNVAPSPEVAPETRVTPSSSPDLQRMDHSVDNHPPSSLSPYLSSSFPSSPFIPTSPLLPPPPPGREDGGNEVIFFDDEYIPIPIDDTGKGGGEHEEAQVYRETISAADDAGGVWRRHTRVYDGGVCLACLANGGGFYGEKVPLEERVPR